MGRGTNSQLDVVGKLSAIAKSNLGEVVEGGFWAVLGSIWDDCIDMQKLGVQNREKEEQVDEFHKIYWVW